MNPYPKVTIMFRKNRSVSDIEKINIILEFLDSEIVVFSANADYADTVDRLKEMRSTQLRKRGRLQRAIDAKK